MTETKRIIYSDIQLNDCDNILVQFTKTKWFLLYKSTLIVTSDSQGIGK